MRSKYALKLNGRPLRRKDGTPTPLVFWDIDPGDFKPTEKEQLGEEHKRLFAAVPPKVKRR